MHPPITKPTDKFIRDIIAQHDALLLESGVAISMTVLQSLKETVARYSTASQDAQAWTEAIAKLIPLAQPRQTVVSVVGNTGAGKYSVINAMLDEERLVLTNRLRACTAVVT
jgi:predicted GTPase